MMSDQGTQKKVRVLVVDDEPDICDILQRFISERGYEVRTAFGGLEAVELFKQFSPHFVLLDIMMPEVNGIDALQRIRELDKTAIVLMATALHDLNVAKDAINIGASDYITKPIDLQYLSDYLEEHSKKFNV
ncbi:MAG: response regulator [bacterium]|nr:response regulator [bacterium]